PGEPCDPQRGTAALVRRIDPVVVLALGDNQYTNGTLGEFEASYDPTWGAFLARTRPVPGNHEYRTDGAAGYFEYFGARASPGSDGDYGFDVGRWRLVALNSAVDGAITAAQLEWVRSDLREADRRCELAYWHHPRFSSGTVEGNDPTPDLEALWAVLVDEGVDIVLNGHAHQYERFAPLDADGRPSEEAGIREFVVGTGGGTPHAFEEDPVAGSLVRRTDVHGVLELELRPRDYAWRFVSTDERVLDWGTGECHP
ncbi:MAG: metallophosphoesterase family protein, partial [Actinomycetota bacterium]